MSATERAAKAGEDAEARAATAMEHLVGTAGFGGLLGRLAENTAALSRLSDDAMDLVLRNLRLSSRRDILRLSQQLARTEDKLERLLQEIEALQATTPAVTVHAPAARSRKAPSGKPAAR